MRDGVAIPERDDAPHNLRIRIWDKATDEIVYDNQMDADDDADATTAIEGGNIKIHKS